MFSKQFQNHILIGASVARSSEVHTAVMMVLTMTAKVIKEYKGEVTSSGMLFLPSFTTIRQMFKKLYGGAHADKMITRKSIYL